jgi:hypothetical protein
MSYDNFKKAKKRQQSVRKPFLTLLFELKKNSFNPVFESEFEILSLEYYTDRKFQKEINSLIV